VKSVQTLTGQNISVRISHSHPASFADWPVRRYEPSDAAVIPQKIGRVLKDLLCKPPKIGCMSQQSVEWKQNRLEETPEALFSSITTEGNGSGLMDG